MSTLRMLVNQSVIEEGAVEFKPLKKECFFTISRLRIRDVLFDLYSGCFLSKGSFYQWHDVIGTQTIHQKLTAVKAIEFMSVTSDLLAQPVPKHSGEIMI